MTGRYKGRNAARRLLLALWLPAHLALAQTCGAGQAQVYGALFEDVQRVLPDPKAFVDATPTQSPAGIAAEYRHLRDWA